MEPTTSVYTKICEALDSIDAQGFSKSKPLVDDLKNCTKEAFKELRNLPLEERTYLNKRLFLGALKALNLSYVIDCKKRRDVFEFFPEDKKLSVGEAIDFWNNLNDIHAISDKSRRKIDFCDVQVRYFSDPGNLFSRVERELKSIDVNEDFNKEEIKKLDDSLEMLENYEYQFLGKPSREEKKDVLQHIKTLKKSLNDHSPEFEEIKSKLEKCQVLLKKIYGESLFKKLKYCLTKLEEEGFFHQVTIKELESILKKLQDFENYFVGEPRFKEKIAVINLFESVYKKSLGYRNLEIQKVQKLLKSCQIRFERIYNTEDLSSSDSPYRTLSKYKHDVL